MNSTGAQGVSSVIRRRRWFTGILILLILLLLSAEAAAENTGFGFVNAKDVALRRGIGGKTIVRLPRDTCVWIKDSKTDRKGVLWYEVSAGLHIDYTNADYSGWMKAEFIDAGDAVWNDVKSISLTGWSLVALRKDGTIRTAGSGFPFMGNFGFDSFQSWDQEQHHIQQAGFCMGLGYCTLDENGVYHGSSAYNYLDGYRIRLICEDDNYAITDDNRMLSGKTEFDGEWVYPYTPGAEELSHAVSIESNSRRFLLLMDDGSLFVAKCDLGFGDEKTEPDWEEWKDLSSVDASVKYNANGIGIEDYYYAGVKNDGTVIASPEKLFAMIGDWTEMSKISIGDRWILGLKRDGTVVTVALDGNKPLDLSGWRDVVDIGARGTFCAGVKEDGTMLFAGDYIFMREGHNRK